MRCFAQISGGQCVAITVAETAPTPIGSDTFVELPAYDTSYLGRGYVAGAWVPA